MVSPKKHVRPKTAYDKKGCVNVPLYDVPSQSKLDRPPKWSFTKDKCTNFLTGVQKRSKLIPGPGSYETLSSFTSPSKGQKNLLSGKSKRVTVIDEIAKLSKPIPAPNHYKNISNADKLRFNQRIITFNKADGNGFLDECEFNGKTLPGPNKYEPNVSSIKSFRQDSPNHEQLIIGQENHQSIKDGNLLKLKDRMLVHMNAKTLLRK